MPSVIFNVPDGRLEGRFHQASDPSAPAVIILHPNPQHGGTMNNKVVYKMYHTFVDAGFFALRFNFRGVGHSVGTYTEGENELADAAAALDWVLSRCPSTQGVWIAGFSFGAWIGMQLLMRRPELVRFVSISPPANMYDFTFLAPCPTNGLVIQGGQDDIVLESAVAELVDKIRIQRGLQIDYKVILGANHFFAGRMDEFTETLSGYLTDTNLQAAEPASKPLLALTEESEDDPGEDSDD